MNLRWKSVLIAVQALLIVGLVWTLALYGRDEFQADGDGDDALATPAARVVGNRVLIPAEAQRAAGIAVESAPTAEYRAAQRFFGAVADPRSLVDARHRYLNLSSQMAAVEAALTQRRAELARIQGLYNEGRNATTRELEAAQATLTVDEQRLLALQTERRGIVEALRVTWGEAFAAQPGDTGGLLGQAAARAIDVVQFVVPPGFDPRDLHWRVAPVATGTTGVAAHLIGRSPQALAGVPGETWLLTLPPSGQPAGSRVRVSADSSRPLTGVRVPPAAVVRFGGKAWVYVRVAPEQFERQPLATDRPLADGLFSDTLTPQSQLVVSGAQLLLSEEFKFQIKNENSD